MWLDPRSSQKHFLRKREERFPSPSYPACASSFVRPFPFAGGAFLPPAGISFAPRVHVRALDENSNRYGTRSSLPGPLAFPGHLRQNQMMINANSAARTIELSRAAGFDLCGIAPAGEFPELAQLDEWLDRGYAGEMQYLHDARRRSP